MLGIERVVGHLAFCLSGNAGRNCRCNAVAKCISKAAANDESMPNALPTLMQMPKVVPMSETAGANSTNPMCFPVQSLYMPFITAIRLSDA